MEELSPRQLQFLANYLDPKSETFSNACQSALKAGYSQEYSESITTKDLKWLSENVGDAQMLNKAIRNLDILLDENEDKKVKADITKFVAERLGKKRFSSRQEITGEGGQALVISFDPAFNASAPKATGDSVEPSQV